MLKRDIKNLEDAFIYLSDCQFATMEDLFFKKSTPKCEMDRQISISMTFVEYAKAFNISLNGNTRMEEFIRSGETDYKKYLKVKYPNIQSKFF